MVSAELQRPHATCPPQTYRFRMPVTGHTRELALPIHAFVFPRLRRKMRHEQGRTNLSIEGLSSRMWPSRRAWSLEFGVCRSQNLCASSERRLDIQKNKFFGGVNTGAPYKLDFFHPKATVPFTTQPNLFKKSPFWESSVCQMAVARLAVTTSDHV